MLKHKECLRGPPAWPIAFQNGNWGYKLGELKVETWKIDWLATPYYGYASAEGKKALVLPRYQRSYVWDDERRRQLVESINRNFPIGALIVRKTNDIETLKDSNGNDVECTVYEVIDGLQRSTSLIFHQLHPLQVVSSQMVAEIAIRNGIDLDSIAATASKVTKLPVSGKAISVAIAKWAQTRTQERYFDYGDDTAQQRYFIQVFSAQDYWVNGLIDNLTLLFDGEQGALLVALTESGEASELNSLLHLLQRETAVSGYPLPVIVWDGPSEDAAEIFFRVNQGGVKLSKYQVMAASWAQTFTDIKTGELADAARKILMPSPGSVVIKKATSGVERLDLYETLVGMSSLLEKSHPELFKVTRVEKDDETQNALDSSTTPHIAFNIAALVCKTKLSEMKSLPENMKKCDYLRGIDGEISVDKLWKAIKEASQVVSDSLLAIRFAIKGANPIAHAEQPMAAIIARVAVELLKKPDDRVAIAAKFKKTLPGHYLADTLGGITSSHGTDAAAFARVWVTDDILQGASKADPTAFESNHYYIDFVPKQTLENALDAFWREQLSRKVTSSQKGKPTVDAKQKLVLRYLVYKKANWEQIQQSTAFHIDHSLPFAVLKDWSQANGGKEYSGGSIANLAILPDKINLSKSKLTIEEWLASDRNTGKNHVEEDKVWSLLPYGKGDIPFITTDGSNQTSEAFDKVMTAIWQKMRAQLIREAQPIA